MLSDKQFASLIVRELGATISEDEAKAIYLYKARNLPAAIVEEYQAIILLEASECSPGTLDAHQLRGICDRVSHRLRYAAHVEKERFTPIENAAVEAAAPDQELYLKEVLEALSLEEQSYVVMKMSGFTLKEIAAKLDLPVSTVHHHWKRLVSKLETIIERE